MLFLTLALSMASPVATQQVTPPVVRRTTTRRVARARPRSQAPSMAQLRITPTCGMGLTCAGSGSDSNSRYRVNASVQRTPNFKTRVVERSQGMACGTTGAPVCPSNGMRLLSSSLE